MSRVPVLAIVGLMLAACGDSILEPELELELALEPEVTSFVTLMNAHRTQVGCAPLEWNVDVAEVATAHSADMIDRDFFAHTNPDGQSPFDRMTAAGISYSYAAENIAWGYPTGEAVLDAWLNSPGHRANIENCSLAQHGVGLVGTHWTHLFRTP
ncbi:MAG: CAP domain-containing protein [Gemmatimonadota bacterium]|nr:CAP domain-containing protein [Gemmatimonadota bacterium]